MRRVAKSARIWSRRLGWVGILVGLVWARFWGAGFIAGFLRQEQRLIGAGGPRTDRLLAQTRIERLTLEFGEFIEERFGPGAGGQDAADRRQGESTETDGMLQGSAHVGTLVVSHQRQQLLRLQLALDLLGEQTVEELLGDGAQLAEALPQEQDALRRVGGRMVVLEFLACARHRAGQEPVAGDLVQAGRID